MSTLTVGQRYVLQRPDFFLRTEKLCGVMKKNSFMTFLKKAIRRGILSRVRLNSVIICISSHVSFSIVHGQNDLHYLSQTICQKSVKSARSKMQCFSKYKKLTLTE